MQNKTALKNWIAFWKSTKGFFNNKSEREHARSWNERWRRTANGMAKQMTAKQKQKQMGKILGMLNEAGFKIRGARILDIGCGPGAISIPFAKAGASVTALDISKTALERLQADAAKEGLKIKTIEKSWQTANIDKLNLRKKFDLVFATNTPALKEPKSLDRMIECSRYFCFYGHSIHSGGHMRINHSPALKELLEKEPSRKTSPEMSWFMYGFMYLYLNGFRPTIKLNHFRRNMKLDWEQAADHTIRSLEFTGGSTAVTKRKIREHYKYTAVNGKCRVQAEGYSGMMVWNVKN